MAGEGASDFPEETMYHTLYPTDQVDYRDPYLHGSQYEESFDDTIGIFNRLPIKNWSGTEALDWANSVCSKRNILLYSSVNIFRTIRGKDLLRFSEQDFTRLVGPVYGPLFFSDFQVYKLKELSSNPERKDHSTNLNPEPFGFSPSPGDLGLSGDPRGLEEAISFEDFCRGDHLKEGFIGNEASSLFIKEHVYLSDQNQWSSSLVSENLHEMYNSPSLDDQNEWSSLHSFDQNEWSSSYSFDQKQRSTSAHAIDLDEESTTSHSSTDRSEELSSHSTHGEPSESFVFKSIPTNTRRKRSRGLKSWEFLLQLLKDPLFNPRLIEWVDRDLGVFRLVDKNEISRIWGTRKRSGREEQADLTYENFSRSLRYYYKTKELIPVPKKHLQYRFGPCVMQDLERDVSSGK